MDNQKTFAQRLQDLSLKCSAWNSAWSEEDQAEMDALIKEADHMSTVVNFKDYVGDDRIRFVTLDNHGVTNEDGSAREHCCGCWNVFVDPKDPFTVTAECNECGEVRTARVAGIEP